MTEVQEATIDFKYGKTQIAFNNEPDSYELQCVTDTFWLFGCKWERPYCVRRYGLVKSLLQNVAKQFFLILSQFSPPSGGVWLQQKEPQTAEKENITSCRAKPQSCSQVQHHVSSHLIWLAWTGGFQELIRSMDVYLFHGLRQQVMKQGQSLIHEYISKLETENDKQRTRLVQQPETHRAVIAQIQSLRSSIMALDREKRQKSLETSVLVAIRAKSDTEIKLEKARTENR